MLRKVTTQYGTIEGVPCGDPRITVFKGVPYAKPPVGELRWRAPQPPEPWQGVLRADRFPNIAVHTQPGEDFTDFYTKELNPTAYEYTMSEDCLYLNIWSPARSTADKLPVFFYIHGGGFTAGYSYEVEFDGERVARNDVIFITVGYRLGALGFFSHPELDEPSQGNQGLLDQLMALKWVKENIAAFGGDPERVTICGQSAGGMSVSSHLNSPLSQGYFHGAIMMSGGGVRPPVAGVGPWLSLEEGQENGKRLLDYLGVKSLEQARGLPAEVIVRTALGRWPGGKIGPVLWRPTVDGVVFTEDLRDSILGGRSHNVPIMIGCCKGENLPKAFRGELASTDAFRASAAEKYGSRAEELLALCDLTSDEALHAFASRELGLCGGFTGAMAYARRTAQLGRTAYTFVFDPEIPGDDAGSFHGSDMWFVFDSVGHSWRPFEGKHYDLARQVSSYWANFVKTGDPNGTDRIGKPLPRWEQYTEENPFTIIFQDEPGRLNEGGEQIKAFTQKYFLDQL